MFETALPLLLYIVNSVAGSIYIQKFLKGKYRRKVVLFVWASLYFFFQSLILESIDAGNTANYIVKVTLDIAVALLLQRLLSDKDLLKQLFAAISFIAGKETIKYIIVVLMDGQHWIVSKFSVVLAKQITTMEEVRMWNGILTVTKLSIYVLLYALLMCLYLSMISKKFIRKNESFRTREYVFLILPSVASLCISITLKMLIYTVEDGMTVILFDKMPATRFWVPLICLLSLGVNISSVMLFQKLVQLGEEEKKRAILENQILQMQWEIAEIQDIYADMRGLRHDMKSHLESIAAVVRRISGKDKEELDEYIEKMDITVSRLDFTYRTGNPITDVIIHQKKQEAEKRNIVIPHFIYFQIYYISVKFDKAPVSNKMTFPPSDSLLPEPFMLSLSHIHRKKLSMEEGDPNKKDRSHHP